MRGEMLLIYLIAFLASLDMLGLAPLMAPYARAVGAPFTWLDGLSPSTRWLTWRAT